MQYEKQRKNNHDFDIFFQLADSHPIRSAAKFTAYLAQRSKQLGKVELPKTRVHRIYVNGKDIDQLARLSKQLVGV